MAEARQVETEAATYLDQLARYHITRGKLISKVAKYPHVVSITQIIEENIYKVAKYPHVVSITHITGGKLISKVAKYPHVVSITQITGGKLISKVAKYPHVVSITPITEENSYLK